MPAALESIHDGHSETIKNNSHTYHTAVHFVNQVLEEASAITTAAFESGQPLLYFQTLRKSRNGKLSSNSDQVCVISSQITRDTDSYDNSESQSNAVITSTPQKSSDESIHPKLMNSNSIGHGDEDIDTQNMASLHLSTDTFINHLFDMSEVEKLVISDETETLQVNKNVCNTVHEAMSRITESYVENAFEIGYGREQFNERLSEDIKHQNLVCLMKNPTVVMYSVHDATLRNVDQRRLNIAEQYDITSKANDKDCKFIEVNEQQDDGTPKATTDNDCKFIEIVEQTDEILEYRELFNNEHEQIDNRLSEEVTKNPDILEWTDTNVLGLSKNDGTSENTSGKDSKSIEIFEQGDKILEIKELFNNEHRSSEEVTKNPNVMEVSKNDGISINTYNKDSKNIEIIEQGDEILEYQELFINKYEQFDNRSSEEVTKDPNVLVFPKDDGTSVNTSGEDTKTVEKIEEQDKMIEHKQTDKNCSSIGESDVAFYEKSFLTLNRDCEQMSDDERVIILPQNSKDDMLQEVDLTRGNTSHHVTINDITKEYVIDQLNAESGGNENKTIKMSLISRCKTQGAKIISSITGWLRRKTPATRGTNRYSVHAKGKHDRVVVKKGVSSFLEGYITISKARANCEEKLPESSRQGRRRTTSLIDIEKGDSDGPLSNSVSWKFNNTVMNSRWSKYSFEPKAEEIEMGNKTEVI